MSSEVKIVLASVPAHPLVQGNDGAVIGTVNANTILHALKQAGFVIVPATRLRTAVHEVMDVLTSYESDRD